MKKPNSLFLYAGIWNYSKNDTMFFIKCNMCGQYNDKDHAYSICFRYYERMLKKLDSFSFTICRNCFETKFKGKNFDDLAHVIPILKIKDNGMKNNFLFMEEKDVYKIASEENAIFHLGRTDKEVDAYLKEVRDWIKYKSKDFTPMEKVNG